jgi:hypothetical protein
MKHYVSEDGTHILQQLAQFDTHHNNIHAELYE